TSVSICVTRRRCTTPALRTRTTGSNLAVTRESACRPQLYRSVIRRTGSLIAYTMEADMTRGLKIYSSGGYSVGNEYIAQIMVHEIAHYAGVLERGDTGGVVIDPSNPRTRESTLRNVVTECFRFVP